MCQDGDRRVSEVALGALSKGLQRVHRRAHRPMPTDVPNAYIAGRGEAAVSVGALERWSVGALGRWSVGALERWGVGALGRH